MSVRFKLTKMISRFNLNRLSYFVATIEAGTITRAAESLGVSKAVVSKQLQLLEHEVGTALLLRNTRKLRPTEAGLVFYESAKGALTQAANAFEQVQERDKQPRGRLRVACPVDYGVSHVAPFAARFQEIYPNVEVELSMSDETVDLICHFASGGSRIRLIWRAKLIAFVKLSSAAQTLWPAQKSTSPKISRKSRMSGAGP